MQHFFSCIIQISIPNVYSLFQLGNTHKHTHTHPTHLKSKIHNASSIHASQAHTQSLSRHVPLSPSTTSFLNPIPNTMNKMPTAQQQGPHDDPRPPLPLPLLSLPPPCPCSYSPVLRQPSTTPWYQLIPSQSSKLE